MLTRAEKAKQRWGGNNQAIDHWLNERQQLLVGYCQLAGLPPYTKDQQELPAIESIREFCGQLVDYVSAGHFEVYDHITREHVSRGHEIGRLTDDLFPLIADTTDIALDFNDRYGNIAADSEFATFDRDLSALGEAIELRLEFEDRLLGDLDQQSLL
ncbi:Rsd/AlgQ family anti-sigma factor [Idiomarina xiamenensis]|uniref:Anti-RNA polymerase sigma 70 factor n=1 Tax=Idiomarina xiamenensis 10-D-4 TaxID=740709 RepID=K2KPX9_9GAMM|nr:Rsd/AlgQ family anti-sigma factor [Idiomarina xiamenensis]EKE84529.1 anti-RNA polymerase sigma 70 factor [Idiomarina xiamenensis 10-D-4]